MADFTYTAQSLADTDRLGAALARALPPGSVIALNGPLGAGKTRLVQAVAETLGIPRERVTSPTFVLVNEYKGSLPIYHFDAYRLKDTDEFLELGPDEYFDSEGLTFIEWAERVEECLPKRRVEIEITLGEGEERRFQISASGDLLEDLQL